MLSHLILGLHDNRQTKSARSSLSLQYRVRMEYLRTQTLILSVWHHDTFGRNSFLGEVDVDLSKWDFDHAQMNYLALKARVRRKAHTHKAALSMAELFSHQITAGHCGLPAHFASLFELVVSHAL